MKRWIWLLIIIIISIPLLLVYSNLTENNGQNSSTNDINNEEEIIEDTRELSEEELIMKIVNSGEENQEKAKEILKLLPEMDFDEFERINGEGSVLNLLEWFSKHKFEEEEDIITLINLTDLFIGKEYLAYMESVAKTFTNDKIKFIKALAKVPDKTEDIASGMYNIRIYDRSHLSLFNDLNMIMESEELTEEEREVGVDLINIYASCIT